jgi:NADPH-dependent curcumin reductase CurA
VKELAAWVREGRIAYQEDIQQGFENAPRTFLRLFRSENVGKQLLKLADPPIRNARPE